MGHLTNPVGLRLGISRSWEHRGVSKGYFSLEEMTFIFSNLLSKVGQHRRIQRAGIVYSHSIIRSSSNLTDFKIKIESFVHDSLTEISLKKLLSKIRVFFKRRQRFLNRRRAKRLYKRTRRFRGLLALRRIFKNKMISRKLLRRRRKKGYKQRVKAIYPGIILARIFYKKYFKKRFKKKLYKRVYNFRKLLIGRNKLTLRGSLRLRRFIFIKTRGAFFNQYFKRLITMLSFRAFKTILYKNLEITFRLMPSSGLTARAISFFAWRKLKAKNTLNQTIFPIMKGIAGNFRGFQVNALGRYTRRQRASLRKYTNRGPVPKNSFAIPVDYFLSNYSLKYGVGSLKIWCTKYNDGFEYSNF